MSLTVEPVEDFLRACEVVTESATEPLGDKSQAILYWINSAYAHVQELLEQ